MSTYQDCKAIRQATLNRAAEVIAYPSWGTKFVTAQIRATVDMVKNTPGYSPIDPSDLSNLEMDDLGFGESSPEGLRQIPLWLLPYLVVKLTCADDLGSVAQRDTREFSASHHKWLLSYSVMPKSTGELTGFVEKLFKRW